MENNQIQNFKATLSNYETNTPFVPSLHIANGGDLDVYFSPFEYVNTNAKIVLVGMSPGGTQAQNANIAAKNALKDGKSLDEAGKIAKETGSFSGALRNNLVALLDNIGVSEKIGIESAISLFNMPVQITQD